jgi:hypothetical protein
LDSLLEEAMTKNMGRLDRILRVSLAIVLGAMVGIGLFPTTLGIIFGVIAVVMILTSAISFCPLYLPFKHNTLEEITDEERQGRVHP